MTSSLHMSSVHEYNNKLQQSITTEYNNKLQQSIPPRSDQATKTSTEQPWGLPPNGFAQYKMPSQNDHNNHTPHHHIVLFF